jgi:DNA-binding NarL/FixJ family response regulator
MKFLIIDDNPRMRKIIVRTICSNEDSYKECSDGIEANKAYAEYHPDFVLMDIQMKTMNGLVAAKKLLEQFPKARIIIITDYDRPSFRQAAFKAGAFAFVSKENLFEVRKHIKNEAFD